MKTKTNKRMNNWKTIFSLAFIGIISAFTYSCDDGLSNENYFTTDAKTLTEILESEPGSFSEYVAMLKKTGYYSALESYGSYTCFVPVNSAIDEYIYDKWGVNSISELNTAEQIEALKELVKFHTMPTKKWASSFAEGRLADTTYSGDFLTTSFLEGGGLANVTINRQAKLVEYDISTDNGVIHSLDEVLDPFIDGVASVIETAGKHTIFVEALKQTGYFDQFNKLTSALGNKLKFTILAETDSIYNISGITSFQDLSDLISPDDDDYENTENPLNIFIGYHASESFSYSSDFTTGFVSTLSEGDAVKVEKTDFSLKLNETESGENDTWVSLVMSESNYPAKNGVYHTVDTLMTVFVPKASYIIWDPAYDSAERKSKTVNSYNKVTQDAYENIYWYPENNLIRFMSKNTNCNLNRTALGLANCVYYEFTTPVIPKGQYDFFVCGNGSKRSRGAVQIYWDDEPIGTVWDLVINTDKIGWPDSTEMQANHFRHGLKSITRNSDGASQYDQSRVLRFHISDELLCPEQKQHTIKLVTTRSGALPLDYFEWIPVE